MQEQFSKWGFGPLAIFWSPEEKHWRTFRQRIFVCTCPRMLPWNFTLQGEIWKFYLISWHQSKIRGKVEFPNRLIENLFMTTIQEIICHVGGLLNEISVDAIILVGGFSESKFVYQSMKDAFKNVPILKPHEGSLSVLKGALLYGSKF